MGDISSYSDSRIKSSELDGTNFVGVDNLLPGKQGRVDATYAANTPMLSEFLPDDILLGNIRPYLKKIWLSDRRGGCSGDVLAIRISPQFKDSVNPKFLYYLVSSEEFFSYNSQNAKGAKMPRGSKSAILKYQIPIPSLETQEKIIEILDKFDELVNDISVGLPAELTARRQQYEHYRDRLLSFEAAA